MARAAEASGHEALRGAEAELNAAKAEAATLQARVTELEAAEGALAARAGAAAAQRAEELAAKDANCESLTVDLVDSAARERALKTQVEALGRQLEEAEARAAAGGAAAAEATAAAEAALRDGGGAAAAGGSAPAVRHCRSNSDSQHTGGVSTIE